MEHIVTHRDKDPIFTIKDVTDREVGLESVAVCREVWGVYDISQEEGVTPFLCPQLRPIYCGRLHCQIGFGLCRSLQSMCMWDRGPFRCGRQCLLCPPFSSLPNRHPSLLEAGHAATRCPVMTQNAVQFSGEVWDGSGRANPECLTGTLVTPLSGTPSPSYLNNAGTKVSLSSFSTGPKTLQMPGVTRCTNAHSFWSDFSSPAYSDCG